MKPLHWFILLVALAIVFPCSRERSPMHAAGVDRSPGVAETEGDDRPDDDRFASGEPFLDELERLGRLSLEEAWPAFERMKAWFKKAPVEATHDLRARIESLSGRARLLAAELLSLITVRSGR